VSAGEWQGNSIVGLAQAVLDMVMRVAEIRLGYYGKILRPKRHSHPLKKRRVFSSPLQAGQAGCV
jgi:hypothetical protein